VDEAVVLVFTGLAVVRLHLHTIGLHARKPVEIAAKFDAIRRLSSDTMNSADDEGQAP
jgi:hypothetical protein